MSEDEDFTPNLDQDLTIPVVEVSPPPSGECAVAVIYDALDRLVRFQKGEVLLAPGEYPLYESLWVPSHLALRGAIPYEAKLMPKRPMQCCSKEDYCKMRGIDPDAPGGFDSRVQFRAEYKLGVVGNNKFTSSSGQ